MLPDKFDLDGAIRSVVNYAVDKAVQIERQRIVAIIESEKASAEKYIEWFKTIPPSQQYSYEDDAMRSEGTVQTLSEILEEIGK
jgi:hypothetical protein